MKTLKNLGKTKALLLADFILANYGPMSHLKLQKLLYYCEAYHLSYFDKELLDENFQAWVHGPVCIDVYHSFKDKSVLYSDMTFEKDYNPTEKLSKIVTSDQLTLLKDVLEELSTWTGLELESATHKETPWTEARTGYSPGDICNVNISKDTMLNFYKAEMNG